MIKKPSPFTNFSSLAHAYNTMTSSISYTTNIPKDADSLNKGLLILTTSIDPHITSPSSSASSILSSENTTSVTLGNSQPLYTQVIIVLMYVLIIVVAVGGNLLCAYIIVLKQKIWTVTNLFLLNLCISDVVKALICNPFSFMANLILQYWPFGDFMCPAVTYVQVKLI